MSHTVFFSWQADTPAREGRNLIEQALKSAVERIAADVTVEESARDLRVDRDTKGVPGSPRILETIFQKIEKASIFVPDVTACATNLDGELLPNPNVLIEYGWALRSHSEVQIVAVMNEAYGKATPISMPFHLRHFRFPIAYDLSKAASDEVRRTTRERLSKQLESAIRVFLESDEFKAKIPKPPQPPPFPRKLALNGHARFRPKGVPLGNPTDPMARFLGLPQSNVVHLADGPAMWLRLMPKFDPGPSRRWLIQDLRDRLLKVAMLPLMRPTSNSDFRAIGLVVEEDGCGRYLIWDGGATPEVTYSVAYMFITGEIWIINAWTAYFKGVVPFEENSFSRTLDECVGFLDSLGYSKPYQWIVGVEGAKGHRLVDAGTSREIGFCLSDLAEDEGIYSSSDKAADLLKPFFERVFDHCGARYTAKAVGQ